MYEENKMFEDHKEMEWGRIALMSDRLDADVDYLAASAARPMA